MHNVVSHGVDAAVTTTATTAAAASVNHCMTRIKMDLCACARGAALALRFI